MAIENKFAVIFPGQGSQSVGMLADFYGEYSEVRSIFDEASSVLNYDLWDVIQNGPVDKLNSTEFTQPALLAAGYSIWQVFCKYTDKRPNVLAGHSLGEYTALAAAEAISLSDAIKLVAARGKFMQEAVPKDAGAMAAILGLDNDTISLTLEKLKLNNTDNSKNIVEIANLNAIGQTVIAGDKTAVLSAIDALKSNGAKIAKLLDVSVPSHCSLMHKAADNLSSLLVNININRPKIDVIHNQSLKSYHSSDDIKKALVNQLVDPVRWVETIQLMVSKGIENIFEFGPGAVLSKLTKRIDKSVNCAAIDSVENLQNIINPQ